MFRPDLYEGFAVTTAAVRPSTISIQTDLTDPRRGTFTALRVPNFRIYLAGQSVANTGAWMQSIAQDWLVHELTGSASAVGLTMALQFLPMLLFGLYGGMVADRYRKRIVLLTTGATNAALTTALAVLTLTGEVRAGHVYLFALAAGLVFVVDNPTRQVFVNEVVPAGHLRNAIALNAAVFQSTRLLGPAVAALLIGTVGIGWAFAANAVCYVGPLIGLALIRRVELLPVPSVGRERRQLRSALRHVAARPHVAWTMVLVGVVGMFGLNFPVVLTAMASTTFRGGAELYGLFNVVLAVGSVAGALIAGRWGRARPRLLILLVAGFGAAQVGAAVAPVLWVFLAALVGLGVINLVFQAVANSSVQLWVAPAMRGRVMGLYMLAFVGGTPLGAPLIGWITTHAGPRVGMAVCGAVPMLAAGCVAVLARRAKLAPRP
ncbi:MAG TPA: MFS transporter [Pseudonocardia sp.]|uniref:MFS transporter n=1 Tax=Pseudonocardia sp. TaxID=60912 RepID=UPI002CEA5867|nr:MFS transporter [Pseudonocardia sp.]HTF50438.1 MFS transporter [Pseudonocardia sp.]